MDKQIEELARELLNACGWRFGKSNDYKEIFNYIAEYLVEQGYRKIDGRFVLFTKEEWKQIKNSLYYSKGTLEKKLDKESKETAEKIFQELLKEAKTHEFGGWIEIEAINVYKMLIDKAKQFGVEVEQ